MIVALVTSIAKYYGDKVSRSKHFVFDRFWEKLRMATRQLNIACSAFDSTSEKTKLLFEMDITKPFYCI